MRGWRAASRARTLLLLLLWFGFVSTAGCDAAKELQEWAWEAGWCVDTTDAPGHWFTVMIPDVASSSACHDTYFSSPAIQNNTFPIGFQYTLDGGCRVFWKSWLQGVDIKTARIQITHLGASRVTVTFPPPGPVKSIWGARVINGYVEGSCYYLRCTGTTLPLKRQSCLTPGNGTMTPLPATVRGMTDETPVDNTPDTPPPFVPTATPLTPPPLTPVPEPQVSAKPVTPDVCGCHLEEKGAPFFCAPLPGTSAQTTCTAVSSQFLCGENSLRCRNRALPASAFPQMVDSGVQCGCTGYVGSATEKDSVLCATASADGPVKCGVPSSSAMCPAGFSLCSSRRVLRIHVAVPANYSQGSLAMSLGEAVGTSADMVVLISACPNTACKKGVCPYSVSDRRREGCQTFNFPTAGRVAPVSDAGRHAFVQQHDEGSVPLFVDFDIHLPEPQRSDRIEELFQNLAVIASGQTSTQPQLEALRALSATGFQNVIMPVEDASVGAPPDAHVYWISKLWWAVLLGAMAVVFVVIAAKKRAIFSHQVSFFATPRCSKGDEMSLSMDNPMCGHPSVPLRALRDSHVELSMDSILQHDYNEYSPSPSPTAPPTQVAPFTNGTAPVYVGSHQRTALKLLELDPVPAPRKSIVSCTTTSRSSSSEPEITI